MLEKSMQRLKHTRDSGNTYILLPMGGVAPELEAESLETE